MAIEDALSWQKGDILLDQYTVIDKLGEGGMGAVYKVHHHGWNIDLAVKNPKQAILALPGGKEQFIQEAETWVNLELHPHIVNCYYVRSIGGIPRIFAEYVAGGSLVQWIDSGRLYAGELRQVLTRMLDIAIQFAWGLHAAHEQGLVHQDVKPANVMLTLDEIVKVTDFGLARVRTLPPSMKQMRLHDNMHEELQDTQQSLLVSHGGMMTPAYCSPEQARREALSRKTDIWSWGISVLHMFTGEVTWASGLFAPVVLEDFRQNEETSRSIPPLPQRLADLLERCFQDQPGDRPATMLDVADTLQEIYREACGRPYPRLRPEPERTLANTLNNRALSLLDLQRYEEAMDCWREALYIDPHHLEATYNQGMLLWRTGELTDEALLLRLELCRQVSSEVWKADLLLVQVRHEQGDLDGALALLRSIVKHVPQEPEPRSLLQEIQASTLDGSYRMQTWTGHTGRIRSVDLDEAGSRMISAGADGTVRIWDGVTGRCVQTLEDHGDRIHVVKISRDGQMALSVGKDNRVQVWDVSTGLCIQTLQHAARVDALAISRDNQMIITSASGSGVHVWEIQTGRCIHAWRGHAADLVAIELSEDDRLVFTGYMDGTIELWEMHTEHILHSWHVNRALRPQNICLSQDGSLVLTAGNGDGESFTLWDVGQRSRIRDFITDSRGYSSLSLSGDGRLACSGRVDGVVRIWDVESGSCLRTLRQQTTAITALSLSQNGQIMLSASADGILQIWHIDPVRTRSPLALARIYSHHDVASFSSRAEHLLRQTIQALTRAETQDAIALDYLRDVRSLAGWERVPESLALWQMLSKQCYKVGLRSAWLLKVFRDPANQGERLCALSSVGLSTDGRTALTANVAGRLHIWDLNRERIRRSVQLPRQKHEPQPRWDGLEASVYGALSVHADGVINLWDIYRNSSSPIVKGDIHLYDRALLDSRQRFIVVGSSVGAYALRLWDISAGWLLRTLTGHTAAIRSLALSMDSTLVLSGSNDHSVRIWDIRNGRCLHRLQGHTAGVSCVCFTTDNHLAFSGSWDRSVRIWDVQSGRCLHTLQGHQAQVSALCVSEDNRFIFSGDLDGLIRIWDVQSGHCLWILQGHTDMITSIVCSADAHQVLSGSADGTARLWELDWDLEVRPTVDWDEDALPFLETFLALHSSYRIHQLSSYRQPTEQEIEQFLTPGSHPSWDEEGFQRLLLRLQRVGYGWLRSSGVRRKLAELVPTQQQFPPY